MKTYDFRKMVSLNRSEIVFSVCGPRCNRKRRPQCDTCVHLAQYESDLSKNGAYDQLCDADPFAVFNGKTDKRCKRYIKRKED